MALDIKVSQFWDCEENVASWIACAIFERVEMSEREERVEFYNMFRENGDWKTNENNQWADALVEYFNNYIIDDTEMPKTLKKAMSSTIYTDLIEIERFNREDTPAVMIDIKALYERDEYNHKTDDSDDEGYVCDCCQEKIVDFGQDKRANRGSCSDGNCKHEPPVESLCGQCGTWDEDNQVWRCPDCQEENDDDEKEPEPDGDGSDDE